MSKSLDSLQLLPQVRCTRLIQQQPPLQRTWAASQTLLVPQPLGLDVGSTLKQPTMDEPQDVYHQGRSPIWPR